MITIIWELNKDYIGQIMLTVGSVPCSLRNGILKWWKMKKTSQSVVIFSMSDEEEFPRKLNSPSGFVFKPFKKISYWKLGIQLIQINFMWFWIEFQKCQISTIFKDVRYRQFISKDLNCVLGINLCKRQIYWCIPLY